MNKLGASMHLDELFKSLANEIKGGLDKTRLKGQNLAKGEDREGLIIKKFFRRYLPPRLGIGRGEIIDIENKHSRQMDIILYDDLNTPIPYEEQSGIIIFNELVFAVFEVKSNLDRNELENSFSKTKSAKQLEKRAYVSGYPPRPSYGMYGKQFDHFPTLGGAIAFDSINLETLGRNLVLLDLYEDKSEQIDSIVVLDKGLITNYDSKNEKYMFTPTPNTSRVYITTEQEGSALLFFYLLLFSFLTQAKLTKPFDPTRYIQKIDIGEAKELKLRQDLDN